MRKGGLMLAELKLLSKALPTLLWGGCVGDIDDVGTKWNYWDNMCTYEVKSTETLPALQDPFTSHWWRLNSFPEVHIQSSLTAFSVF